MYFKFCNILYCDIGFVEVGFIFSNLFFINEDCGIYDSDLDVMYFFFDRYVVFGVLGLVIDYDIEFLIFDSISSVYLFYYLFDF